MKSTTASRSADDAPLEFQVIPEVGLKHDNVEFVLGMPLNQVITLMQNNARILLNIELAYSKKDPFERDITICLRNDGIKLFFDSVTQLLRLIEVDNLSRIVLKYCDKVFSKPGSEASVDKVDVTFGSTHPGDYDEKHKMYVQSWRGLSFCFPNSGNVEVTPGFGPKLRSLKYESSSQPRLTKMSLFKGTSINKREYLEMPIECYCGQNRTEVVKCIKDINGIKGVDIVFWTQATISPSSHDGDLDLVQLTRTINFGDSVAKVMSSLGAPSKVFYKAEDKMMIHKAAGKQSMSSPHQPHIFFNYFSMGMDILFDFTTKRVIKFILHSNMPGHYDFGIYSRCNFEVVFKDPEQTVINTKWRYDEMCSIFNDPRTAEPRQPVVVSRNTSEDKNPFGSTFCYGTDQLIVEVMQTNKHIATMIIYDAGL